MHTWVRQGPKKEQTPAPDFRTEGVGDPTVKKGAMESRAAPIFFSGGDLKLNYTDIGRFFSPGIGSCLLLAGRLID